MRRDVRIGARRRVRVRRIRMSFDGARRMRGGRHRVMAEGIPCGVVPSGSGSDRVGRERGGIHERQAFVPPLSMPYAQSPRIRHERAQDGERIEDEERKRQAADGADGAFGCPPRARRGNVRQGGTDARAVDACAPGGEVVGGAVERGVRERLDTLRNIPRGVRDANLERRPEARSIVAHKLEERRRILRSTADQVHGESVRGAKLHILAAIVEPLLDGVIDVILDFLHRDGRIRLLGLDDIEKQGLIGRTRKRAMVRAEIVPACRTGRDERFRLGERGTKGGDLLSGTADAIGHGPSGTTDLAQQVAGLIRWLMGNGQ